MKSMCHEARRNSPSVADCRPTSSCVRTISRIASSSTARSLPARVAADVSCCIGASFGTRQTLYALGDEREKGEPMATVETDIRECRQFVGGEWVDAEGAETFDDVDPFN